MHRRFRTTSVLALLVVSALAAIASTAQAAPAARAASAGHATCLVHSLPSFVDQGELADAATVADAVEVECNPYIYGTGAEVTITAAQLYYRCQKHITWYLPNTEEPGGQTAGALSPALDGLGVESGLSVNLHLDADGNATVALLAGPGCMAGESLITLDEDEAPYETFTTSFQVLPPVKTPQGVSALPPEQVEDATFERGGDDCRGGVSGASRGESPPRRRTALRSLQAGRKTDMGARERGSAPRQARTRRRRSRPARRRQQRLRDPDRQRLLRRRHLGDRGRPRRKPVHD